MNKPTYKQGRKNFMKDELKPEIFWYSGPKGMVGFDTDKMMKFVQGNGIFRYYTTQTDYIFVQVVDNLVKEIDIPKIKRLLMDHVIKNSDTKTKRKFERMINILTGVPNMMLLEAIEIPFFMDGINEAHFFYSDGIIKISKGREDADVILYKDFQHPVWKSSVINRPYPTKRHGTPEFLKFLNKVFKDEESRRLIKQAIGYLLHCNRNRAFSPTVILSDNNDSDNSQGGTGKGIIRQALGYYLKTTREDGKTFDPKRVFSYQGIDLDTKLLFIDDAKKYFSLENLFSIITEGFIVEKKNKQRFEIPFEHSPKVIINTNYAIRGDGESNKRRRIDIALDGHYTATKTPYMEFGHMLFDDWSVEEWENFDMFMLECAQLYLDTGVQRVSNENLIKKQLRLETHPDFEDWLSRLELDVWHSKSDILKSWMTETNNNEKMKYSKTILTKWITKYETVRKFKLDNDRKDDRYKIKSE